MPEVRDRLVITGMPDVSQSLVIARLEDWDERKRQAAGDDRGDQSEAARIPGVQAFANIPGSFGQRGRGRPIEFVIQTSGTYEELQDYVDKMMERMATISGPRESSTPTSSSTRPNSASRSTGPRSPTSASTSTVVGRTLETLLGGRQVTRFEQNGEQYDVWVQLAAEDRASPDALPTIFLRNRRRTK